MRIIDNPKISIVTAVFNGEEYIEQCILSIKNQKYKNFEHIIVDGGSTDNTLYIIKKYENTYNMKWISEQDNGMYDAICKGFAMASGDIFAWLNYDDMYLENAFTIIATVFSKYNISWCTGFPMNYSQYNVIYGLPSVLPIYFSLLLRKGYYGLILRTVQQESTFWTKELWNKANGNIISNYNLSGDYWLWLNFAKYAKLYTLDAPLAGFRIHEGQKSSDFTNYQKELLPKTYSKRIIGKIARVLALLSLFKKKYIIETENIITDIDNKVRK